MTADELLEKVARAIFVERKGGDYCSRYPEDWEHWREEASAAIRIVLAVAKDCVGDENEQVPHNWHATRQVLKCVTSRIDEIIPPEE